MKKYKVIVDVSIDDIDRKVGDVLEFNPDEADTQDMLAAGVIEEVVEEKPPVEDTPKEEVTDTAKEETSDVQVEEKKKRHISGKMVLIDGMREVNGREFHHVRLEDGSELDLTEKEYQIEIKETL